MGGKRKQPANQVHDNNARKRKKPANQAHDNNEKNEDCVICKDHVESGKHYGVLSCEGCKVNDIGQSIVLLISSYYFQGFFKRAVRDNLHKQFNCREGTGQCLINKTNRNRCKFCRFHKCLDAGMKVEAVQERRKDGKMIFMRNVQEYKDVIKSVLWQDDEAENSNLGYGDMPIEGIMEAEMLCEKLEMNEAWARGNMESVWEKQLSSLVQWAKNIPHFTELAIHDQVLFMIHGLTFQN